MRVPPKLRTVAIALTCFIGGNAAFAAFHIMQVEQFLAGVNGDASAQAIQLRMRSSGQSIVSAASLWVADATGANRVLVVNIPSNVAIGSAGARVLLASPNFTYYAGSGFSPDFTTANRIPTNYFKAGRLTYEDDGGSTGSPGTIYWSVSWGGTNYTGANTGNTANDADGNFGPAFNGPLPSTSTSALKFLNAAAAPSVSNALDYAVTSGSASFVKNSGQSFAIIEPRITAIRRETNNIRVTWTVAGKTNSLQRSTGSADGSYSTNFTNIYTGSNGLNSLTNYLDVGGATNPRASYYRVRFGP